MPRCVTHHARRLRSGANATASTTTVNFLKFDVKLLNNYLNLIREVYILFISELLVSRTLNNDSHKQIPIIFNNAKKFIIRPHYILAVRCPGHTWMEFSSRIVHRDNLKDYAIKSCYTFSRASYLLPLFLALNYTMSLGYKLKAIANMNLY